MHLSRYHRQRSTQSDKLQAEFSRVLRSRGPRRPDLRSPVDTADKGQGYAGRIVVAVKCSCGVRNDGPCLSKLQRSTRRTAVYYVNFVEIRQRWNMARSAMP